MSRRAVNRVSDEELMREALTALVSLQFASSDEGGCNETGWFPYYCPSCRAHDGDPHRLYCVLAPVALRLAKRLGVTPPPVRIDEGDWYQ